MAELPGFVPDWPAPRGVRAFQTVRASGDLRHLATALALPAEPSWLEQAHGARVATPLPGQPGGTADAAVTRTRGTVLAVRTADCLPVLLCDRAGSTVAAVHAGWRGLAAGVLEAALAACSVPPRNLLAWFGPAIGRSAFEVGPEVRDALLHADPRASEAFVPGAGDRWHADLCMLARQRLYASGVSEVHGGGWCTVSDAARFHSYRRDGATARMATLIWLE